jgi:hypothetical protein
MAGVLTHDDEATGASASTIRQPAAAELTEGRQLETAELHRLYPRIGQQAGAGHGDPLREIELLRELLAERDKRITDRDTTIDALRCRLAAADEERRAASRKLMVLLSDKRAGGVAGNAMRALGRVLDCFADMLRLPPTIPAQEQRTMHDADGDAAREVAEKALLEQIARHHRRWFMRDGSAAR